MKKLISFFTAAALSACICLGASAAEDYISPNSGVKKATVEGGTSTATVTVEGSASSATQTMEQAQASVNAATAETAAAEEALKNAETEAEKQAAQAALDAAKQAQAEAEEAARQENIAVNESHAQQIVDALTGESALADTVLKDVTEEEKQQMAESIASAQNFKEISDKIGNGDAVTLETKIFTEGANYENAVESIRDMSTELKQKVEQDGKTFSAVTAVVEIGNVIKVGDTTLKDVNGEEQIIGGTKSYAVVEVSLKDADRITDSEHTYELYHLNNGVWEKVNAAYDPVSNTFKGTFGENGLSPFAVIKVRLPQSGGSSGSGATSGSVTGTTVYEDVKVCPQCGSQNTTLNSLGYHCHACGCTWVEVGQVTAQGTAAAAGSIANVTSIPKSPKTGDIEG